LPKQNLKENQFIDSSISKKDVAHLPLSHMPLFRKSSGGIIETGFNGYVPGG
jgi:hypothetical protein